MRNPNRRERRQLERLRQPTFFVEIRRDEIVRQLESHEQAGPRR